MNKLFALSVLTIVGWIAAISISLSSKHIQHTIILGRFAFAFASAMPFTLLYMFQAFPVPETRPRSLTLTLPGIFCAVFILLSFSPWIVTGAVPTTLRSQFLYGPIYPLFSAYAVSCFAFAIYTLWRKIHLASGIKKLQLRYLLLGILLGGAGAMTTNLFIPLLWNTSRFSTLGPYFSLVMVTFSAHAIIRYRLMDIKVVIQKGVVYVSAIAVTAAIFLSLPTLLSSAIGHKMDSIPLGLAVAMAIVVAILFQPLKRLIQDSFNRYLYRQPYDYQRIVTQASQRLSTILDLKSLLRYLTDTIATTLNLEFAAVYISDDAEQMFTPKAVYQPIGAERGAFDAPLPRNSDLVAYLERAKRLLLRDDPSDNSTLLHRLPALRALKTLGGDAAFPIVQDNRVAGVIAIGPKLSGDPLYTEDL
ncbi:MAG: GAF domain-containing protein, partial [Candidatus Methylomirabilia bacterium]